VGQNISQQFQNVLQLIQIFIELNRIFDLL